MRKIHFTINTCFRYKEIIRLLFQIEEQSSGFDVTINLFNDGTPSWMTKHIRRIIDQIQSENFKINYFEFDECHTKYRYWQLVTDNFQAIKNCIEEYDYYFMLPDDAILTDDFIVKAISIYDSTQKVDNTIVCLNTFTDTIRKGTKSWGTIDHFPVKVGDVWDSGWMDMEFICKRNFFEVLEYRVDEIDVSRWKRNPSLGSGVGQQISERIEKLNCRIYQVDDSLTYQNEHNSVMNAGRDFTIVPSKNMRDDSQKIFVNISTMASRKSGLDKTVKSLLENSIKPDSINIYVNDYDDVSDFLKQHSDVVNIHLHPNGDLKAAGRILLAETQRGYIFHCDDDLIYPVDYIQTMINHIEYNHRTSVITVHGTIVKAPLKKNYYKERTVYRCLHEVKKSVWVNVAGCGASAYHSSTLVIGFNKTYDVIESFFFTDMWVAVAAQINKVPILCIAHNARWLIQTPESIADDSDGIYHQFKDGGGQVEIVNKMKWGILVPDHFEDLDRQLKDLSSCRV